MSLDELIARARATEVRTEHARRHVGRLERWARVEARPARRWPWLVGVVAVLAIAIVLAWPPSTDRDALQEALQIGALEEPTEVVVELVRPVDAVPALDGGVLESPALDAAPRPVQTAPDAAPVPEPPALVERWRTARLLRGQGRYAAAIIECVAIADAHDATWSPIALVEAARIAVGPLAAPERAIAFAERFAADWPVHDLAPEARELRCRALHQLGRACATDAGP